MPKITTLPMEEGVVTALHLGTGYTTSVRLPEEISSVVIGNPTSFKAEHSEAEPRLVFLKPITAQAAESNALITTKSGQEISLYLISSSQAAGNSTVDFLVEYRRPPSLVISSAGTRGLLMAEANPVSQSESPAPVLPRRALDVVGRELESQKAVSSPAWEGKEILAAVGESSQCAHQTVLRFSVLNNSRRVIELLPPQIEFSGIAMHKKGKAQIKAEPIAVSEYRLTSRRLAPGERVDGVVVFARPAFKESNEKLQLQLVEAAQVDRPILVSIPFTPTSTGGEK
ncbi:MAG TPA: hypothetical protein VF532_24575 [Candidatus Angelobacter sp.]